MRGRAAAVLAALLVTLTTGATAIPASAASPTFTDIGASSFPTEVGWLADRGVTTGWDGPSGREYRPTLAVTRDAMAAFLYRLAGSPEVSVAEAPRFIDVPTDSPFFREITWLAASGISTGWDTPAGREFRPFATITRDAMATFLYRWKGNPPFTPASVSPFEDVATTYQFYRPITWLAANGISTGWDVGYGCRYYRPWDAVTRDAMAAFMYRAVVGGTAPVVSRTCSPPPPPPPSPVTPPAPSNPTPWHGDTVTPGAFCAKALEGWYGRSKNGVLMRCIAYPGEKTPRWRAA